LEQSAKGARERRGSDEVATQLTIRPLGTFQLLGPEIYLDGNSRPQISKVKHGPRRAEIEIVFFFSTTTENPRISELLLEFFQIRRKTGYPLSAPGPWFGLGPRDSKQTLREDDNNNINDNNNDLKFLFTSTSIPKKYIDNNNNNTFKWQDRASLTRLNEV